MWLGSHLVPFELSLASGFSSGALSYLPIGAAIFPWLAVRSGFRRASEFLNNPRGARTFVVIFYTALATIAAVLSESANIKPNVVLTPIFVALLALGATVNYQSDFFLRFRLLFQSLVAFLGISILVIGISLILHFEIVKSLAIVIQPGIMGGILFTVLQLLYLPNFALAGISYLIGPGFALGLGTLISPLTLDVTSLPAIPILGALPTAKHPIVLLSLLIPLIIFSLNQIKIFRRYQDFKYRQREIVITVIPILIALAGFSYFSGGTLLTQDMNPVGTIWWKIPAIFGGAQLVTLIIGLYIPKLVKLIRAHKSEI